MEKEETCRTLMWEESSFSSNHDPLDCFLGGSEGESSDQFVCESHDAKFVEVGTFVSDKVKRIVKSQDFARLQQSKEKPSSVSRVNHSQIGLGELLGGGAFSNVFEIKTSLSDHLSPNRCVVKVLRRRVIQKPKLFAACAVGLLREGSILASMNHENIIQVHAFSQTGPSGYATGRNDACFLVLERLDTILSDRLDEWALQGGNKRFFSRHKQQKNRELLCERLMVAQKLACALGYLHNRSIVHRDIKPNNIGFDANGTLKLFDFDVSRILPKERYEGQRFHLTKTGTKRYMSPECGLGHPYNQKTDVYSFAIVCHQVLSLEIPYGDLDMFQIKQRVYVGGLRPWIPMSWPQGIKRLLKNAWSENLSERPNMDIVISKLTKEIIKLERQMLKKRFALMPQKGSQKVSTMDAQ